jgi:hypothetical protein
MKKKLAPAKTPLPRFRSDEEAADYFESHSVAGVWNQLPGAKPAKVSKAAKSLVSIRLAPEQIAAAKKRARAPHDSRSETTGSTFVARRAGK